MNAMNYFKSNEVCVARTPKLSRDLTGVEPISNLRSVINHSFVKQKYII